MWSGQCQSSIVYVLHRVSKKKSLFNQFSIVFDLLIVVFLNVGVLVILILTAPKKDTRTDSLTSHQVGNVSAFSFCCIFVV